MATRQIDVFCEQRRRPDGGPIRRIAMGLAPMLLLYIAYSVVRWLVRTRGPIDGPVNARDVLDVERRLGLDWERELQRVSLSHDAVITAANWYYVAGFLPVILGFAALSAWRAPDAFRWWRKVFVVTLLMALVGFVLFPLAPPRMLPSSEGFVDTLAAYGPQYYGDHEGRSLFNGYGSFPSLVNVYAAMPSMHVAWSAIAGALLAASLPGSRLALLTGVLHPILMGVAVLVTANHYVLDVLIGGLVLGVGVLGVVGLDQLRSAVVTPNGAIVRTGERRPCGTGGYVEQGDVERRGSHS